MSEANTFGKFKASKALDRILRGRHDPRPRNGYAKASSMLSSYFQKLNDIGSMHNSKSRAYFSLLHYKDSTRRVRESKNVAFDDLVKDHICNIMHAAYSEFYNRNVVLGKVPEEIWIHSYGKSKKYRAVK